MNVSLFELTFFFYFSLNLINCDCAHISEIMEKLYDF